MDYDGQIVHSPISGTVQFSNPYTQAYIDGSINDCKNNTSINSVGNKLAYCIEKAKNLIKFRGVRIKGNGKWQEYVAKMFYIYPYSNVSNKAVTEGEAIGTLQDYDKTDGRAFPDKKIQNHIHFELARNPNASAWKESERVQNLNDYICDK